MQSCECDICCDKEGGGWSRSEDGLEEVGEEVRHDEQMVDKLKSFLVFMRVELERVRSFGEVYAEG